MEYQDEEFCDPHSESRDIQQCTESVGRTPTSATSDNPKSKRRTPVTFLVSVSKLVKRLLKNGLNSESEEDIRSTLTPFVGSHEMYRLVACVSSYILAVEMHRNDPTFPPLKLFLSSTGRDLWISEHDTIHVDDSICAPCRQGVAAGYVAVSSVPGEGFVHVTRKRKTRSSDDTEGFPGEIGASGKSTGPASGRIPTRKSDFGRGKPYILESQLRPSDYLGLSKPVGLFNGAENIYSSTGVTELKSQAGWERCGREVISDQLSRPVRVINKKMSSGLQKSVNLYSESQTLASSPGWTQIPDCSINIS